MPKPITSTFDTGDDDWTIVGDVESFSWTSTAGDPPGSIAWVDAATGQASYYAAPAAYLGDKVDYYGGNLSYDILDTGNGYTAFDVELIGAGHTLQYTSSQDAGFPTPNVWTSASVSLTAANFIDTSTSAAPTVAVMQAVMSDLTTLEIRAEYVNGPESGGLDNVSLSQRVVDDFNGDGFSDISFQNTNGAVAVWEMNGAAMIPDGAATLGNPGAGWRVIGSGEFYDDGKSDLLFQNSSSGQLAYWGVSQGANGPVKDLATTVVLSANPGPTWRAIATGDFNGDGFSDIAFQNTNGAVAVWEMNGAAKISDGTATLGNPGTSWQLRATGDFYGDGASDLLFQNTKGALAIWGISQGASHPMINPTEDVALTQSPGAAWQVVGTGDFNGDGKSDIVFQNAQTGAVAIWEMNGAARLGAAVIDSPGTAWAVKSVSDYNGDGLSDMLLQNSHTGALEMLFMNGLSVSSSVVLADNPGASWAPTK